MMSSIFSFLEKATGGTEYLKMNKLSRLNSSWLRKHMGDVAGVSESVVKEPFFGDAPENA